jgi:hypothetical protein
LIKGCGKNLSLLPSLFFFRDPKLAWHTRPLLFFPGGVLKKWFGVESRFSMPKTTMVHNPRCVGKGFPTY